MERTYQELLDTTDDLLCQNSEFIEINKRDMNCKLDEQDYSFFWGCMKLFNDFDKNYFAWYLNLINQSYGDFSGGIAQWLEGFGGKLRSTQCDEDYLKYFNALDKVEIFWYG